jgi:hypothetical protein
MSCHASNVRSVSRGIFQLLNAFALAQIGLRRVGDPEELENGWVATKHAGRWLGETTLELETAGKTQMVKRCPKEVRSRLQSWLSTWVVVATANATSREEGLKAFAARAVAKQGKQQEALVWETGELLLQMGAVWEHVWCHG